MTFKHHGKWLAFPAMAMLACIVSGAHAAENEIKVTGAIDSPSAWTTAKLKSEFATELKSVVYSSHGQKHTSICVPLLSFLRRCGVDVDLTMNPKADPTAKNLPLRYAIVVRGHDGYLSTFSLAELMPEIGNKEAWLALDVDGAPLLEKNQPANLIVPSDIKPGRWVHGVGSITIVDESVSTPAK